MQLKAILNRIQKHRGFVYGPTRVVGNAPDRRLEVDIYPHRRSRPRCSQCRRRGPQYDTAGLRCFDFVPLWGLSLIHISEPTRLGMISYAVFCLKKKKTKTCWT